MGCSEVVLAKKHHFKAKGGQKHWLTDTVYMVYAAGSPASTFCIHTFIVYTPRYVHTYTYTYTYIYLHIYTYISHDLPRSRLI